MRIIYTLMLYVIYTPCVRYTLWYTRRQYGSNDCLHIPIKQRRKPKKKCNYKKKTEKEEEAVVLCIRYILTSLDSSFSGETSNS